VLLRVDLADAFRSARPPFARSADPVFRSVPKYETFIRDCVRAGIVELDDRGRQIPDDRGRTVDRHALRTTFCTWLSSSGASPRTAQMLARHTDIRLTMKTYTDPILLDERSAVEALPDLSRRPDVAVAQATGTDNDRANPVVSGVVLDVAFPQSEPFVSVRIQSVCRHAGMIVSRCRIQKLAALFATMRKLDKMEAAGIEPASRSTSGRASTCVVALGACALAPAAAERRASAGTSLTSVSSRRGQTVPTEIDTPRGTSRLSDVSPTSRRHRFDGSPI